MSVNLNFSVSTGFNYLTTKAIDTTDKLASLVFNILDGTTTQLGRLLPDLRPTSVGDVILHTKMSGSALLSTEKGDILIEITRDPQDRYIFKATGESLEPVIFYEGKKNESGYLWEIKVSNYLQLIVKRSKSVSYGVTARRWKENQFEELKSKFSCDGHLRQNGQEVTLKLPDEELLIFEAPFAAMKAELVLKFFYQSQKTPLEEAQSRPYDLLTRLFVGYLYFSAHLLSPWIRDHVLLPHQVDEERARQMASDGYLDSYELQKMAKNPPLRQLVIDIADERILTQLASITFESNGYTQKHYYEGKSFEESYFFSSDKHIHSLTICTNPSFCEAYITEESAENLILTHKIHANNKIEVKKSSFQREGENWTAVNEDKYVESLKLPDSPYALSIMEKSQQVLTHTAIVFVAGLALKHNPKIAHISSLLPFIHCVGAQPLSTKQISLLKRTPPITVLYPIPNLSIQPGNLLTYNIDLKTYCQLSNPPQNV